MCHDLDPDECVAIFTDEPRKARKEHRCEECRRAIHPGESYRYEFGKFDGDPVQYKTCAHCSVGREWLLINCRSWIYSGVLEDIIEHFEGGSAYPAADRMWLGRVAVGMKRKWRGGAMPIPKPARALPHGMAA